jgi:ATP-dependent protease ClpP protease subunit
MTGEQAKGYGIVDFVIAKREEIMAAEKSWGKG